MAYKCDITKPLPPQLWVDSEGYDAKPVSLTVMKDGRFFRVQYDGTNYGDALIKLGEMINAQGKETT